MLTRLGIATTSDSPLRSNRLPVIDGTGSPRLRRRAKETNIFFYSKLLKLASTPTPLLMEEGPKGGVVAGWWNAVLVLHVVRFSKSLLLRAIWKITPRCFLGYVHGKKSRAEAVQCSFLFGLKFSVDKFNVDEVRNYSKI